MPKNGNGYKAEDVISAVEGSRGFVTEIAKRLGCTRTYVYQLIDKYPTAKKVLQDEREGLKDFAEGKLLEQIKAGNMTAIIFYLKTQGKDRGYIERTEISGPEGEAIKVDAGFEQALKEIYGKQ